ncbi:MAG TPA: hypothetical protein IGS53_07975 [Leptolyngbyaceae cyanobacterium M33_DOE_097]|uniref:Uncharacterized protein n=1 Tax=Oscillatoriales cyanobacterium SpSt-418 TaxID=2282169 RepID=A0A7C3KG39_9CYAN|nr:hypothetical protein [Leptolyngbyaceae cyanobacterium M33_DOE_097]
MIPKHPRRKAYLAPDQIFSAGFRDGMAHRPHHPRFQNHPVYLKGYVAGSCSGQDEPSPFFEWSDLHGALRSIARWEQDQARLGFGRVALSFRDGWWIVLISEDLYQAALHF